MCAILKISCVAIALRKHGMLSSVEKTCTYICKNSNNIIKLTKVLFDLHLCGVLRFFFLPWQCEINSDMKVNEPIIKVFVLTQKLIFDLYQCVANIRWSKSCFSVYRTPYNSQACHLWHVIYPSPLCQSKVINNLVSNYVYQKIVFCVKL